MFFTFYYQINTLIYGSQYLLLPPTTLLSPLTKYSCLDYVIIRKKAPTHSLMKLCIWSITHLQKCGTVVILMKICAHFFYQYILHTYNHQKGVWNCQQTETLFARLRQYVTPIIVFCSIELLPFLFGAKCVTVCTCGYVIFSTITICRCKEVCIFFVV